MESIWASITAFFAAVWELLKIPLAVFMAWILPIQGVFVAVGIAIIFDTALYLYKVKKLQDWRAVRQLDYMDILGKMALYQMVVLSLYGIDRLILSEFMKIWFSTDFFITKIVALCLIVLEVKSAATHFEAARKVNLFNELKATLTRSKEIKKDVKELIEQ